MRRVTQQTITYLYDASGKTNIIVNALGERTINRFDALGRLERMDITGTNGVSVRNREFFYTLDNHFVEHYEGTGATETYSASYLDHAGRSVMEIQYPDFSSAFKRVVRGYDSANNLIVQEEDGEWDTGAGFSGVQLLATNGWTYDGLNRLAMEASRDGTTTTNRYNAIGTVTNQFLPGGLKRVATFTTDGRITQEYVIGSGSERMNERSYAYYLANGSHPGKLHTITDARGVVQTNSYDEWCRLKTVGTIGSQAAYNTTTTHQYDRRGLITQISRSYTNAGTGPNTIVSRAYNAYGELASETVTVGSSSYTASPTWDSVGRRSTLNLSPLGTLGFSYRADGALTGASAPGYGATYTYGANGLLYSRNDGTKSVTYTRDDMGRLTGNVSKFGSTTNLKETLTWRSDTRLLKYVAQRSPFTDTRNYAYAPWSRYLTNEQYYLSSGVTDTQDYQYDAGAKGGLGVLTGAADWDAATNGLDTLKRPFKGATAYARVPSFGKAFGAGSVSATLNGQPVPVEFTQGNTNGWFYAQLVPKSGTNSLIVTAIHPSGLFTNSATSLFTNNATGESVTNLYDAFGNVTRRVWRKHSGGLARQQDYTWNAFNQLIKVSERDANNSGFDWTAAFDGLGRRVRVTELNVISNTPSGSISTTDSYFDPAVEFLELGVSYNGKKSLKVYGPDVSGAYGGAQGIGGLEAVIDLSANTKHTVLNDRFGNVLGHAPVSVPSSFQWSAARYHSCGPKVGYETPFLASGVPLVQALGWQGQRRDLTGLYYANARPYDPVERRFITVDPLGHGASPSLYSYGNGDSANFFDPNGREPIQQISGFTYDLNAGRVTSLQYNYSGQPIQYGPIQWEWDVSLISWQDVIYPYDYNWNAHQMNDRLTQQTYDILRQLPAPAWQPDSGRIISTDMEFIELSSLYSGLRLAGSLAEDAFSSASFTFRTGAQGEQFIADRLAATRGGAPVPTTLGPRYPDVPVQGVMNEVKVGYQSYNSRVITQVEKDAQIVANNLGGYSGAEWHFLRSGITGQVGADARLLDLLTENGIGFNIYSRSILAPAFSETGLFGAGLTFGAMDNDFGPILSKH